MRVLTVQAAQLKNRVDAVWMVELPNTTVQSPAAAPKPVLSPASSAAAARTHDLELLLDIYATLRWFVAKMIPEGRYVILCYARISRFKDDYTSLSNSLFVII